MPRPRNIVRQLPLNVHLPEDIRTRLDLHLFSELEGRVPMGAYQRFLTQLLSDYFNRKDSKDGTQC